MVTLDGSGGSCYQFLFLVSQKLKQEVSYSDSSYIFMVLACYL